MPQSRNENVIYIKITKMYLPKYLLNCNSVGYFLECFCIDYLERFISFVSMKIESGNS